MHDPSSPPAAAGVPVEPTVPPAGGYDAYQITPEDVQDPPRTLPQALRQIGPGLILTASIVGTGELIATTNLGAQAGFALLWLVLVSCFIKVFVQVELGRYTLSSGDTTLRSFQRVPGLGDFFCWWWLVMMLLTQFQIGAMIGGCGSTIDMVLPGLSDLIIRVLPGTREYLTQHPEVPWALILTPLTIWVLVRGRYHVVEGVCTWMVALFTICSVACMALLPWAEESHLPPAATATGEPTNLLMAAFAMVGITGVGAAELIAYPYWCLEKRYARHVGPRDDSAAWASRAAGWLRVMQLDAWFSMVVYTLATLAFYVLGAAVLYHHTNGQGLPGNTRAVLESLAKMYEPALGPYGSVLFLTIGGFIVLYSTLFAATAGNSRVTADFLRVQNLIPFQPPEYRYRWIRTFSALLPLLGLVLYLYVKDPVYMVVIGGVAQAVTLPVLGVVALYVRWRHTDRRLVRFGWWDALLWLSLGFFGVAAGYGIWSEVRKFLGP